MAILDLTGQTFGRLKVQSFEKAYSGKTTWVCICRCGERRLCRGSDLRSGRAKACFTCALRLRRKRLRAAAKERQPHTTDVGKLEALLDGEGRRLYDRWQSNCEQLNVKVSRNERLEVLRELAQPRRTA